MISMGIVGSFKKYGLIILLFTILTILGGVYYKINSEFESKKLLITNLEIKNTEKQNKINMLQLQLAAEVTNTHVLTGAINNNNLRIKDLNTVYKKAVNELTTWKKKPPEVKYVEKVKEIIVNKNYTNSTCDEGLLLNKNISELKYEDM